MTVGISGYVGSGEVNTTVDIENAIAALPGGIGNMPVALELMVVGWMLRIVNIVVNTIVAARFIGFAGKSAYDGVEYVCGWHNGPVCPPDKRGFAEPLHLF